MAPFPHGVYQAWERFKASATHPFARNAESPHNRLGWIDVTHAYSNLWVEIARAEPHWFGRAVAWSTPLWVVVPVVLIVGWII
jgi:hypothetical protein